MRTHTKLYDKHLSTCLNKPTRSINHLDWTEREPVCVLSVQEYTQNTCEKPSGDILHNFQEQKDIDYFTLTFIAMKKNRIFISLMLGGCLIMASPAMAQEKTVRLTTAKELGSPMTLLVNHTSKGITVDWGDGQAESYKTSKEEGICAIEGTVKGTTITISGGSTWDMLSCDNCGLTDIDLSGATELRSLYCQNNQLDSISLKGMTKLVDLDCSNNNISKLIFSGAESQGATDLASIETLNLANNQLSGSNGQYYISLPTLQYLNISGNKYSTVYIYDPQLKGLDCSNNEIKNSLNLTRCTALTNLNCSGNNIPTLKFANSGSTLYHVICDNNAIEELDLTNSADLYDLSCSNNKISTMTVNDRASINSLNVANNSLAFNVLPPSNKRPEYISFEPQAPFDISKVDGMKEKDGVPYAELAPSWADRNETAIDLKTFCSLSSGRLDATYQWVKVNENGSESDMSLVTTSSQEGDYSASAGKFSFFTAQKKAYVKLTSKTYGFVINSTPIAIGDDITGTDNITANSNELQITTAGNAIVMSCGTSTAVNIYTIEGKKAWNGNVYGTVNVTLPKGIYIVNGKKVIL